MFTGIIKTVGRIQTLNADQAGCRLVVECPELDSGWLEPGDSVAVAGVCLTVVDPAPETFAADISNATLEATTLGAKRAGDAVNLEPALAAGQPIGGHLVTGHVDGIAQLQSRHPDGDSVRLRFWMPDPLARFVAVKGSVAIDGVSLTVNRVEGAEFEVNLIPHTLAVTTLGQLRDNERVNLEVDLIARYLDRLLQARGNA